MPKKVKAKKATPRSSEPPKPTGLPKWTVGLKNATSGSSVAYQGVRAGNAARAARKGVRLAVKGHPKTPASDWHVRYVCIEPFWQNDMTLLVPIIADGV